MGLEPRHIPRLPIDFSAAGDNAVIPAVADTVVRVWKVFFVVSDATTITFKNGTTDLTGPITLFAGGSFVLDFDGEPWFVSTLGNAFVISQSGVAQVSGQIHFTQQQP